MKRQGERNPSRKRLLVLLCAAALCVSAVSCAKPTKPTIIKPSSSAVESEDASEWVDSDVASAVSGASGILVNPGSSKTNTKITSTQTVTSGPGTVSEKDPYANIPDSVKQKKVRVLLWYTPSAAELKVFDAFKAKTGINYQIISSSSSSDYLSKLQLMVSGKDYPDVVCMGASNFPTMIANGLIQTIDAGKFDLTDSAWDKEQMELFKWNGKYYGVNQKGNWQNDQYVIYFNKTMFANQGVTNPYDLWKQNKWNWTSFLDTAKKMTFTKDGKSVYGYGDWRFYMWMLSSGVDFVNYTGNDIVSNMTDPKLISAWKFASDLFLSSKVQKDAVAIQQFITGDMAMYGEINFFMKSPSDMSAMKDEWGVAPFPGPENSTYYVPADGKVWCIGANAKNPEGAAYFMRYYLDPKNNVTNDSFVNPAFKDVFDYINSQKHKYLLSSNVINYSNGSDFTNLTSGLIKVTADQVETTLNTYSKTVADNIALAKAALAGK